MNWTKADQLGAAFLIVSLVGVVVLVNYLLILEEGMQVWLVMWAIAGGFVACVFAVYAIIRWIDKKSRCDERHM